MACQLTTAGAARLPSRAILIINAKGRGDARPPKPPRAVTGRRLFSAADSIVAPRPTPPKRGIDNNTGTRPAIAAAEKLRVAVDVDEVLGRFVHSLNQFCSDTYGAHYSVEDYFVYDFAKVWRCSQDESNRRVHEFFNSTHFAEGIEVIPGALDSLRRLRSHCELVVVTSRQHVIREPTLEWLAVHFPGVFDAVHFGNHFALEGPSRKKSEICKAAGAHVLIDDNPHYALECASAGIDVILYDWEHAYPWSKTSCGPSHERITRARDWGEVERVLVSRVSGSGGAAVRGLGENMAGQERR